MKTISLISIVIFCMTACGLGGGTHGSIKGYSYPVTKLQLEKAVSNAIQSNSSIHRDWRSDHYNDTKNYVTMKIKSGADEFEYTFRYLGDSTLWANSSTSEIFICYIYDNKGNGGSAGNEKWEKTDTKIQKNMINIFEEDFIKKIDDTLNVKHTDIWKTQICSICERPTYYSKQAQAGGRIRLLQIQGRFADRNFHFAKG